MLAAARLFDDTAAAVLRHRPERHLGRSCGTAHDDAVVPEGLPDPLWTVVVVVVVVVGLQNCCCCHLPICICTN